MSTLTIDCQGIEKLADSGEAERIQSSLLYPLGEVHKVKLKISSKCRYTEQFFITIFKALVSRGIPLQYLKIVSDVGTDTSVYSLITKSVEHVQILQTAGA